MWPLIFVFVVSLFNVYMGYTNQFSRFLLPLWCLNAIIVALAIVRHILINFYGIDI